MPGANRSARPGKPGERATSERGRTPILVVDDHPLIRQGLRELIKQEPDIEVCGEAASVAEALQRLKEVKPALVIIDLSLGHGHGLELIKQIRARYPAVRMLVLTMHDAALYAERAMQAGASGFVNKQEPAQKVLDAIRRVLAGGVYLSDRFADRILGRLVGGRSAAEHLAQSPLERLSDREVEVLALLGRGMTVKEIAAHLHLSTKTIDAHRDHLKKKLGLKSSSELLRYAVTVAMERPSS
jgi:DNA-binding NarL/FixJ family response regulator